MAIHLNTLLKELPDWHTSEGDVGDVALVTLGRLVRNLPGHSFPGWSTEESRQAVVDTLLPRLLARPGLKSAFHADMADLNLEQRRLLLERKLITPCMAARQKGCHVIISRKQAISIMLNEEEHLVAHFYHQGLSLNNVLTDMRRFAEALEEDTAFAHDDERGYLTSLPSEAGEGIQLYAVLHLPALTLAGLADPISRGLEKLQVSMSPYYNGMQDDTGNIYTLFTNALPLGEARDIQVRFEEVASTLILREIQMRTKLLTTRPFDVTDSLGRAFGQLCYAMRLSYREMLDSLSLLRLGSQYGMFCWDVPEKQVLSKLASLNVELAPAHLAQGEDKKVPPELHSVLRAMRVKEAMMEAGPNFTTPYTLDEPS